MSVYDCRITYHIIRLIRIDIHGSSRERSSYKHTGHQQQQSQKGKTIKPLVVKHFLPPFVIVHEACPCGSRVNPPLPPLSYGEGICQFITTEKGCISPIRVIYYILLRHYFIYTNQSYPGHSTNSSHNGCIGPRWKCHEYGCVLAAACCSYCAGILPCCLYVLRCAAGYCRCITLCYWSLPVVIRGNKRLTGI